MRRTVWATGASSRPSELKLLVDECVARPLVAALRRRFSDTISVAEVAPGARDRDVLDWAIRERRAVVTEDYDFGELVFRSGLAAEAIVIVAPGSLGFDIVADAEQVASRIFELSNTLRGSLTILERTRTRRRPLR